MSGKWRSPRRGPIRLTLAVTVVAWTLVIAIAPAANGYSEATCRAWKSVPFPHLPNGTLAGVAGTSSSDVWPVGLGPNSPIIGHWDGAAWTLSPQGGIVGGLFSVDAAAPDDAWAVGEFYGNVHPLAEHWDGTRWSVVPAPSGGTADSLYSVSAVSANDAWAVGVTTVIGSGLTMHWDGSIWNVITDDAPPYGDILYDVSAVSSDDVWAVGYQAEANFGEFQPFAEHWDGVKWTQTEVPPAPKGSDDILNGVVGISSTDAWAVGSYTGPPAGPMPLVYHWDGTTWTLVKVPTHQPDWNALVKVTATSSTDVWAVGNTISLDFTRGHQLIEHWDGTSWKIVSTPNGPDNPGPGAITSPAPGVVWAVGVHKDQTQQSVPFTEHLVTRC